MIVVSRATDLSVAALFLLADCGGGQSGPGVEYYERTARQTLVNEDLAKCGPRFPGSKNAVNRARCQVDAYQLVRPHLPYPDLVDSLNAQRLEIAEREQRGLITETRAVAELSRTNSAIASEEQRRMSSDRMARALTLSAIAQNEIASAIRAQR